MLQDLIYFEMSYLFKANLPSAEVQNVNCG